MFHLEQAIATAERTYVGLMVAVVGRALVAASHSDDVIRRDLAALPPGFVIQVSARPHGPGFAVRVGQAGHLTLLHHPPEHADLGMYFKHVAHAFLVFAFQEGIARAFANNRIYVDGDVSLAIRLVRCFSRLEVLILPRLIAEHAVKHYPDISLNEKVPLAARIYERVILDIAKGA